MRSKGIESRYVETRSRVKEEESSHEFQEIFTVSGGWVTSLRATLFGIKTYRERTYVERYKSGCLGIYRGEGQIYRRIFRGG